MQGLAMHSWSWGHAVYNGSEVSWCLHSWVPSLLRVSPVWLWLALAAGWCRSLRCCLLDVIYRKGTLAVGWGNPVPVEGCAQSRLGKPNALLEGIASQTHSTL